MPVSCLIFRHFVEFPLVALRTPVFLDRFLSKSPSIWRIICPAWLIASCECPSRFGVVAVASDSYSSIVQPFYPGILLEMPVSLSRNNTQIKLQVHHTIKNRVCLLRILFEVNGLDLDQRADSVIWTSTGVGSSNIDSSCSVCRTLWSWTVLERAEKLLRQSPAIDPLTAITGMYPSTPICISPLPQKGKLSRDYPRSVNYPPTTLMG